MKRTKTLKVRVRDKHAKRLNAMARSVNFVWNYVNELSERAIRERGLFLSGYDIHPYTQGSAKELGLHSQSVQRIGMEYAVRRRQFRKRRLGWRKSFGVRRSLGWIPINTGQAQWKNGQVFHNGHYYKVWDSWDLSQYRFRSASFNEDARGRWYFDVVVDVPEPEPAERKESVGVDLGLKDVATCSDGQKLVNKRFYRDMEDKLAAAQRAGKKKRVRAIHAKIKNRRQDAAHKFSRRLVNQYGRIVVGDVDAIKLAKTRMAKSVHDAGWGQLKSMLAYKCDHAGIEFKEVNERYTTQSCSSCGQRPDSRPRGIAGLGIREWTCACGVTHDRDINAARNILALGQERPAEGIPIL
ncbi:MAG TPA: transposase [Gammaproteobacteria bacterium]|nr:transposase [Gammaproteobacteria bacterium]